MGKQTAPESPLSTLPNVRSYLNRIGAEPRSLRTAVVVELSGKYFRTKATIKFERQADGGWVINAPQSYEPSEQEAILIKAELAGAKWPEWKPAYGPFSKSTLPAPYSKLPDDSLFICRSPDRNGAGQQELANAMRDKEQNHPIIMILARIEKRSGGKCYIPLTYWNDAKWRAMEPDRLLPVFGMEQLSETTKRVLFLHEGGKASRAVRRIAEAYDTDPKCRTDSQKLLAAHLWAFDLAGGVHVGWIGGALRTHDTDWQELKTAAKRAGIERVVIVADNDEHGRNALPKISRLLGMPTDHLIFPTVFPPAFDLADDIPKDAPCMAECLCPGTFMTFLRPNLKGKPTPVLTDAARGEWTYVPEHALYVAVKHPSIAYDRERLNAMLRPLSDITDVAVLIQAAAYSSGRPMRLTYDPGKPEGVVGDGESTALNRHRPCKILPKAGDATPWLEFLSYLVPDEGDCKQIKRWCATLIARRELRMFFGLLLISETQGTGKSTLGYILADLVGRHNASFPQQTDIGSDFNDWLWEKRLAVINEVYAGHSWAAYNALKSAVTEPEVTLNQKFQRKIKVGNWIHIIGCSNSWRALKLADTDRRWFVPGVTETKWPYAKFEALWAWLDGGGRGEIVHWAQNYGDYVRTGEHAPASRAKSEVIAAGRSDAAKAVVRLAEAMAMTEDKDGAMVENDIALAITVRELRLYAQRAVNPARVNETDQELLSLLKLNGVVKWGRLKVGKVLETVLVNQAAKTSVEKLEAPTDRTVAIRKAIKSPSDIEPLVI